MKNKIIKYLLKKDWFIKIAKKQFYTKNQLEGIFWYGVALGNFQHIAVEKIDTKKLEKELKYYIEKLNEINNKK